MNNAIFGKENAQLLRRKINNKMRRKIQRGGNDREIEFPQP